MTTILVPPRPQRFAIGPPPPRRRKPEPPDDELRRLAFAIVEHDPVLAHLLVRSAERMQRQ